MAAERKIRVAIVGAGASGLYASYLLRQKANVEVIHVEADSKLGGRVRPFQDPTFSDYPIELGAEEIHGDKSLLYPMATNCPGAQIIDHYKEVDDYYWLDGQLVEEGKALKDKDMKAIDSMWEWVERYKGADTLTIADVAKQRNMPSRIENVLETTFGSEHGTDNSKLSLANLAEAQRLWKVGCKNFLTKGKSLLDIILHRVGAEVVDGVQLNQAVKHIEFLNGYGADSPAALGLPEVEDQKLDDCVASAGVELTIEDQTTKQTRKVTVDKVLLTVSVGVLQSNLIQFTPALPETLSTKIQKLGFDAGMKIILKFKKRVWPKYMGSCIGGSPVHEFWSTGGVKGQNIHLTAFSMGKNAKMLSEMGQEAALNVVLDELTTIFGAEIRTAFDRAHFADWTSDPWHRGAYSYPAVGSGGSAVRFQFQQAHASGRLFFAGEGLSVNHPATVSGAFESAAGSIRSMGL